MNIRYQRQSNTEIYLKHFGPINSQFCDYNKRLDSFQSFTFSKEFKQDLAVDGFYYHFGQFCKCFYCSASIDLSFSDLKNYGSDIHEKFEFRYCTYAITRRIPTTNKLSIKCKICRQFDPIFVYTCCNWLISCSKCISTQNECIMCNQIIGKAVIVKI